MTGAELTPEVQAAAVLTVSSSWICSQSYEFYVPAAAAGSKKRARSAGGDGQAADAVPAGKRQAASAGNDAQQDALPGAAAAAAPKPSGNPASAPATDGSSREKAATAKQPAAPAANGTSSLHGLRPRAAPTACCSVSGCHGATAQAGSAAPASAPVQAQQTAANERLAAMKGACGITILERLQWMLEEEGSQSDEHSAAARDSSEVLYFKLEVPVGAAAPLWPTMPRRSSLLFALGDGGYRISCGERLWVMSDKDWPYLRRRIEEDGRTKLQQDSVLRIWPFPAHSHWGMRARVATAAELADLANKVVDWRDVTGSVQQQQRNGGGATSAPQLKPAQQQIAAAGDAAGSAVTNAPAAGEEAASGSEGGSTPSPEPPPNQRATAAGGKGGAAPAAAAAYSAQPSAGAAPMQPQQSAASAQPGPSVDSGPEGGGSGSANAQVRVVSAEVNTREHSQGTSDPH